MCLSTVSLLRHHGYIEFRFGAFPLQSSYVELLSMLKGHIPYSGSILHYIPFLINEINSNEHRKLFLLYFTLLLNYLPFSKKNFERWPSDLVSTPTYEYHFATELFSKWPLPFLYKIVNKSIKCQNTQL